MKKAMEAIKKTYEDESAGGDWAAPFSGGKNSRALMQMIVCAMLEAPPEKRRIVHFVNAQTGIDFPALHVGVARTFGRLERFAKEKGLPIRTRVIRPEAEDTLWTRVIGKGLPAPKKGFQWCLDDMKMRPIAEHISQLAQSAPIFVSDQTEKSAGEKMRKHPHFPNAWEFSPLQGAESEEIEGYLLKNDYAPWGETNKRILRFYEDLKPFAAQSKNCGSELKDGRGVCGNTQFDLHFACWACPYQKRHDSLKVYAGECGEYYEWMNLLFDFRKLTHSVFSESKWRVGSEERQKMKTGKKDGRKDYGANESETLTLEARQTLLNELLRIQKELANKHYIAAALIRDEEIAAIRAIWESDCAKNEAI